MTRAEIKAALRDWITGNVAGGVTVIEANQNAPRPAFPYVTMLITSNKIGEHSNIAAPNSDGDTTIENENEIMVSLQSFGSTAIDVMEGLRQSLEKVSARQELRGAGLPFIRVLNGVNDLSETVGTKFEPRAGMDLEFRAVYAVTDNIGVIESVEGVATAETGQQTLNVNYQTGV